MLRHRSKGKVSSMDDQPLQGPKRPLTGFNFFFKEQRQKLLEEAIEKNAKQGCGRKTIKESEHNPTDRHHRRRSAKKDERLGIPFQDLIRLVSKRWKAILPDERARFEKMAQDDKIRYNKEKQAALARRQEFALVQQQEAKFATSQQDKRKIAPSSTISSMSANVVYPTETFQVTSSVRKDVPLETETPIIKTMALHRHDDKQNWEKKHAAPERCLSKKGGSSVAAASGIETPPNSSMQKPELAPLFMHSKEEWQPPTLINHSSSVSSDAIAIILYRHQLARLHQSQVGNNNTSATPLSAIGEMTIASLLARTRSTGQVGAPILTSTPTVGISPHLSHNGSQFSF